MYLRIHEIKPETEIPHNHVEAWVSFQSGIFDKVRHFEILFK